MAIVMPTSFFSLTGAKSKLGNADGWQFATRVTDIIDRDRLVRSDYWSREVYAGASVIRWCMLYGK